MIETRRLKNVVIFFQTILSFVLSRKNNKVDLVKQKEFYPYKYMTDFEKFREKLPSKEKF